MNNNFKNREGSGVIAGLILVAIGAALLLRNMGFSLPGWLFTWPMILILLGIYSGFKHSFTNNSWMILIAIGGFFLINKSIPSLRLEPLFWPMLIIGIGLLFILRPGKKNWLDYKRGDDNNQWKPGGTTSLTTVGDEVAVDSNDYLRINSVFSGVKRNILSKNFQGGQIACVFGGAEIDLSQSDIKGRIYIKLDVVFGGVKLVIPPHWAVQNEIEGVFHGVDHDKRNFNPSTLVDADKVLILKGSAVFGGVEIRSY